MRVVVVGGTGHVGTFLVPRLVAAGHEVISISRGGREPYQPHPAWREVRSVVADRAAEDAEATFVSRLVELKPDVVVDLLCFTVDSAQQLVAAPKGSLGLLLHCGSIWVHGPAVEVPVTESAARHPFGSYGVQKEAIERVLLTAAGTGDLAAAVLHPGHITGPGWGPVNPAGNFDATIWDRLATGQRVALPNFGLETVHHVHADDVAQAFELAMQHPAAAVGQSFHVTSAAAVTLRGFAGAVAGWYGREPELALLPWPAFAAEVGEPFAAQSLDHISHSPSMSIEKARRLLGYRPRFSGLQAVREAVLSLHQRGVLQSVPPED